MITTIYLVRHASYENPNGIIAGRLGLPLSEKGIKESENLKKFFADKKILQIYSSYVQRCRSTAEIISDGIIPITYDLRLLETFTALQGAKGEGGYDHFGYRHLLGGEDYKTIQKRITDFYERTKWQIGSNYVVCSHGDVLHLLYQYIAGEPRVSDFELGQPEPVFKNYQSIGSVRQIIIENNIARIDDTYFGINN